MTIVRTEAQRELTHELSLDNYLKSKDFKKKEPLFWATLDAFAEFACRLDGDPDGVAMAEMLACVLERDGTFYGAIRKTRAGSTLLGTRAGWEQVIRCVSALIVERYLRQRSAEADPDPLMLTGVELRDRITAAFTYMAAQAEELERAGAQVRGHMRLLPPADARPQLNDGAVDRLYDVLARDVPLITPPGDDGEIPESERDREVGKRALVRLRITQLRAIANERGLDEAGTVEQLAERLAASADDDSAEIARMVISQEAPSQEHGLVTTLVALQETPDIARIAESFGRLEGNFARVGVARWFICDSVVHADSAAIARGSLRYYRVSPTLEYERYDLASDPGEVDAMIVVRAGRPWVEVSTRLRADTPALAQLARRVASLRLSRPLPLGVVVPGGDQYLWSRRTVAMLGLLAQDLTHDGIELTNVAVAQFEYTGEDAVGDRAPTVKNVRVGGQHLISHRQVCELIIAGRALTQVRGSVRVTLSAQERLVVPFAIEFGDLDATVTTGFTRTTSEAQTSAVHRRLIDCVQAAVLRSDIPVAARNQFPAIVARAAGENPEEADIIPPPV